MADDRHMMQNAEARNQTRDPGKSGEPARPGAVWHGRCILALGAPALATLAACLIALTGYVLPPAG
ncbi:hypothetical protein AB0D04_20860 [Streptomyces sp. NPDC048483]|uniref:hypothetical protein n=1 Tax=Streptomyces sp. NPDC048483 TaxID=3154927 RepID=UPI00343AD840